MSDDFINQFDKPKPPRPEFTAALYQRITQPMKTTTRTRVLRYFALSFAMVALVATVLFVSTSTRAFADGVIRQFGGYIFVQSTPQPMVSPEQQAALQASKEQAALPPNKEQNKSNQVASGVVQPANDAAAASQLAGFVVLAPSYLPEGYTAYNQPGAWTVGHQQGDVTAGIKYDNQAVNGFLTIVEDLHQQGEPETIDQPDIKDVTVRGKPGVWMPRSAKNTLAWEENGITFTITSNRLSLDEVLKIAESLGK